MNNGCRPLLTCLVLMVVAVSVRGQDTGLGPVVSKSHAAQLIEDAAAGRSENTELADRRFLVDSERLFQPRSTSEKWRDWLPLEKVEPESSTARMVREFREFALSVKNWLFGDGNVWWVVGVVVCCVANKLRR